MHYFQSSYTEILPEALPRNFASFSFLMVFLYLALQYICTSQCTLRQSVLLFFVSNYWKVFFVLKLFYFTESLTEKILLIIIDNLT